VIGALAGGLIGGLVFVGLLVVGFFFLKQMKIKQMRTRAISPGWEKKTRPINYPREPSNPPTYNFSNRKQTENI